MIIINDIISFLNGRSNIRFLPFIHSKDNYEVYYEYISKVGSIVDNDLDKIYNHSTNYILCKLQINENIENYCIKLESFENLLDTNIKFDITNNIFSVIEKKINITTIDKSRYTLSKINYDGFKIINNQRLTDLYFGDGTYSLYMKILRKNKIEELSNLLESSSD